MKRLFTLMTIFCFVTCLMADVSDEKLYIVPEQVRIEKDNILVDFLGSPLLVSGIHVDSQGLHVLATEIIDQHTFSNTCPYGHYSPDGSGLCRKEGCPFQKK